MVEVELKLSLDTAAARKLRRHPLLHSLCDAGPRRRKLYSIYFDTPDLDLRRRGVTLRLRRQEGGWVQTLKGGGQVHAGLHQRVEWETPASAGIPDLDAIRASDWAKEFTPGLFAQLRPVFVTDFWRTAWLLEPRPGEQVELALDQGEIVADGDREIISEIELELKSGGAGQLFELALALQAGLPMRLEGRSKAERGYWLYRANPLQPRRATAPGLSPEMDVNGAFKALFWEGLSHLQENEEGALQETGPEFLHQMRVAVRRLRVALGLFSFAAPKAGFQHLLGELHWLMSQLGPARDWDVLWDDLLPAAISGLGGEMGTDRLLPGVESARRDGRVKAVDALQSGRYTRLLLLFAGWIAAEAWKENASESDLEGLSAPIKAFAAPLLENLHKGLIKRGGHHPGSLDASRRHKLRIAAKKLRYGAEFFGSLYPERACARFVAALGRLQDVLGHLNDAVVARRNLAHLAADNPELAWGAGLVGGWIERDALERIKALEPAWRYLRKRKVFW